MPLLYRLAADATVTFHVAYVMFVVAGQLLILAGIARHWRWIHNVWFRGLHLAAIALVVAESLLDITCPLTTLEQYLRRQAGQTAYRGDFLANALHDFLFFDFEPWVFTVVYTTFGLIVLATFCLAPPRRKNRVVDSQQS
jgi:Protein of Unknown function (DUF2784)